MPDPGVGAWQKPATYQLTTPMLGSTAGRVRYAVQNIQAELTAQGFPCGIADGWFGKATSNAVKAFQSARGLVADGQFGPKSARALFSPIAQWWETMIYIPDNLVRGQISLESGWDPGAQGLYDGRDRGLAQINSYWHPEVTDAMAYGDCKYCIMFVAGSLFRAYDSLKNWDAAIANHNNPAKAREWSKTGVAPDQQIADYVRLVRETAAKF